MKLRKPTPFGVRLRETREALRLTRKQLAGIAKVSEATVKHVERGYPSVSKPAVLKILKTIIKLHPDRACLLVEVMDLHPHYSD
jgi:transcriptional regulator with XRE-family HTH domain